MEIQNGDLDFITKEESINDLDNLNPYFYSLKNTTFLPIFFVGYWRSDDFDIHRDDDPSTYDYAKL